MANRREFLKSCAVGAGALAVPPGEIMDLILAGGRATAGLAPEQVATDEDFWFPVQQAFAINRNYINLNNGTIQNGLRIVQEAVTRHSDFTSNAGAHSMGVLNKEIESVRRRLGYHLGCEGEEIVICRGGSEAGEIPIMGYDLRPGDEVVTTNQDYPRLVGSWKQRVKRDGIWHTYRPGETFEVLPGDSITMTPRLYHAFWAKKGAGTLVCGEVSSINDDNVDNRFFAPMPRYASIEEDEPPRYVLCNEYRTVLD